MDPGREFFIWETDESEAYPVERPAVKMQVKGFWMDETEVTNSQFAKFVEETGYITVAERKIRLGRYEEAVTSRNSQNLRRRIAAGLIGFFSPISPRSYFQS
jgi:formylglycine-generating enzyme